MRTLIGSIFHPSDFTDPVWLATSLRYFDPETATMPLWESPRHPD